MKQFILNLFPWWIWVLHTIPLLFWVSQGFSKSAMDAGLPKAVGWWAFISLSYLLYHINFEK
jgi:hypothetical protein